MDNLLEKIDNYLKEEFDKKDRRSFKKKAKRIEDFSEDLIEFVDRGLGDPGYLIKQANDIKNITLVHIMDLLEKEIKES